MAVSPCVGPHVYAAWEKGQTVVGDQGRFSSVTPCDGEVGLYLLLWEDDWGDPAFTMHQALFSALSG